MRKEIDLDIKEFIGLELVAVESKKLTFDKAVLDLFCPWRIYDDLIFLNSRVLNDKNNSKEAVRIVNDSLIGLKIEDIKIFEFPSDISIEFDNGTIMEVFPDHPIYESWKLKFEGLDGRYIIGTQGGEITWFLKDDEE